MFSTVTRVELPGFEPGTLCLQSRCATSCAIAPNGGTRENAPHVGPGGLEPPTSSLSGMRSNHLSYRPNFRNLEKFYDFAGNAEILAKREYFVNISTEKKFTLNCNIKLNTLSQLVMS